MMRYHLRTLMILLAVGPPLLAWIIARHLCRQNLQRTVREIVQYHGDSVIDPPALKL